MGLSYSVDGGKCQALIPAHFLFPNILEKRSLELRVTSREGVLKMILPLGVMWDED